MALIAVLCKDGEVRCGKRADAAARIGDKEGARIALKEQERYQSLRLKMFFTPN
jgi:hypothetical protein